MPPRPAGTIWVIAWSVFSLQNSYYRVPENLIFELAVCQSYVSQIESTTEQTTDLNLNSSVHFDVRLQVRQPELSISRATSAPPPAYTPGWLLPESQSSSYSMKCVMLWPGLYRYGFLPKMTIIPIFGGRACRILYHIIPFARMIQLIKYRRIS
jgi:hypothetical protein